MDDEGELQRLYAWVDEIPLSRPKRNFTRDFSDGVLVAEIVNHFCPKIVDIHNYSAANATQQKMYNWNTLNQRPFKKLQMQVSKKDITAVCNCVPNAVEGVLRVLNSKISKYLSRQQALKGQEPLSAQLPVSNPRGGAAGAEPRFPGGSDRAPPSRGSDVGAAAAPTRWQPAEARRGPPQSAVPHQPEYQQHQPMQPVQSQSVPRQQPGYPGAAPGGAVGGGDADRAAVDALELQRQVDTEILIEKEQTIQELRETVEILELKVKKLEQLVRIKDSKIHTMANKMTEAGLV